MDCQEMRSLAKQLREGASADIWADFEPSTDDYAQYIIAEATQQAMTQTADFLDRLADIVE